MSQASPTAPALPAESSPSASNSRAAAVPERTLKKKHGLLFYLIVTAGLIGGGWWVANFIYHSIVFEETDDAYIAGHVHQVSPQIAGSITEVLVSENEPVKAGQVLARIDPLPFDIALQKARAALAEEKADELQAHAALEQVRADSGQAEAQSASAEAQVQRVAAQLQIATVNSERDQRLFSGDVRSVAKADVESTKSTAQASTASLAGAKADLAAARARVLAAAAAISAAEAEVSSAGAKVEAQAAALKDAERERSYVEIKAPSDGRIGNRNVEVGNRVQIGQPLFALVEYDCWIAANFKETQLKNLQVGRPVEIRVDAMGGEHFSGKVESIAPATGAQFALLPADNATGNFTKVVQRVPVKIVFDPETMKAIGERMRPGLSTVVSVRIK